MAGHRMVASISRKGFLNLTDLLNLPAPGMKSTPSRRLDGNGTSPSSDSLFLRGWVSVGMAEKRLGVGMLRRMVKFLLSANSTILQVHDDVICSCA
jgi:hypothetical protein